MPDRFFAPSPLDPSLRRRLAREAASGKLRRLDTGLYTDNLVDPGADVIRRGAMMIASVLHPGAILSGRSGQELRPVRTSAGDVLFMSDGNPRRNVGVHGLQFRFDGGPGPASGDVPYLGLHRPSQARVLLENLAPSRARAGVARTLGQAEVEGIIEKVCIREGEARLNAIRDEARGLAGPLGLEREFERLNGIIGTMLGTHRAKLITGTSKARAAGVPHDQECVDRLVTLRKHLDTVASPEVPDTSSSAGAREALSFIEAYFSNYIEGTRFLVGEATAIVFEGKIPENRPLDGRDVLETYAQTANLGPRAPSGLSYPELRDEILSRHADLMAARPDVGPGVFKADRNAAGSTVFVDPSLVEGTLRAGVDLLSDLTSPFGRAVLIHFMLTDVHPFADGNGRLSRIMMTKELLAAGQSRIVIPTVHRDDYVDTLRMLTRDGRPDPLVRCLTFCQRVTAAAAARTVPEAIDAWASAYAFQDPAEQRLRLPDPTDPIAWRRGIPGPASHWTEEDARKPTAIVL